MKLTYKYCRRTLNQNIEKLKKKYRIIQMRNSNSKNLKKINKDKKEFYTYNYKYKYTYKYTYKYESPTYKRDWIYKTLKEKFENPKERLFWFKQYVWRIIFVISLTIPTLLTRRYIYLFYKYILESENYDSWYCSLALRFLEHWSEVCDFIYNLPEFGNDRDRWLLYTLYYWWQLYTFRRGFAVISERNFFFDVNNQWFSQPRKWYNACLYYVTFWFWLLSFGYFVIWKAVKLILIGPEGWEIVENFEILILASYICFFGYISAMLVAYFFLNRPNWTAGKEKDGSYFEYRAKLQHNKPLFDEYYEKMLMNYKKKRDKLQYESDKTLSATLKQIIYNLICDIWYMTWNLFWRIYLLIYAFLWVYVRISFFWIVLPCAFLFFLAYLYQSYYVYHYDETIAEWIEWFRIYLEFILKFLTNLLP